MRLVFCVRSNFFALLSAESVVMSPTLCKEVKVVIYGLT
jgi:hypothetical protein